MGNSESSSSSTDVKEYNAALRHAERSFQRHDFATALEFFDKAIHSTHDPLLRVIALRRSADMMLCLDRRSNAIEAYRIVLVEIHMALFPFPAEEKWTPTRPPLLREYLSSSEQLATLLRTK